MKVSVAIAISGLLAGASAQQMSGLPDCAQSCAKDDIPDDCGLDPECICTSKSFIESITCCVAKSCSDDDQKKTIDFAKKICKPAGVTDIPESAVCDSEKETDGVIHGTAVSTGKAESTDGEMHGTAVSTGPAETTDGAIHGTAVSTGVASTKSGPQTMPPNLSTDSPTGTATDTATGTGAEPAPTTGGAAVLVAQNGAVAAAAAAFALVI